MSCVSGDEMNCREIQNMWLALPLEIGGVGRTPSQAGEAELSGNVAAESSGTRELISRHLEECENCREAFAAEQKWNDLVSRRLWDVALPAGLLERIQQRLAAANADELPIDPPTPLDSRLPYSNAQESKALSLSRRRLLRWGALAATGLVAVGGVGWWFGGPWGTRRLSLMALVEELSAPDFSWEGLPELTEKPPSLPTAKELLIPAGGRQSTPRGLVRQGKEIGAIYRFAAPAVGAAPPAQVVLTAINLSAVTLTGPTPSGTFAQAEFLYYHDRAVKLWGTKETAYACFATQPGTVYLEAMIPSDSIA